jgi:hypothetical protein
VRRGARSTFVVSAALAAIALGSGARADVRTINLDPSCSGSCFPPAIDDPSAAEGKAAKVTLSRSGGARTNNPNDPALVFDPRAAPTALVSGLPSPLASAGAQAPHGVSPYDYFEDVIDIPLPVEARAEFTAASLFLFAPSLIGRLTLTDVLSAGNALFGKN